MPANGHGDWRCQKLPLATGNSWPWAAHELMAFGGLTFVPGGGSLQVETRLPYPKRCDRRRHRGQLGRNGICRRQGLDVDLRNAIAERFGLTAKIDPLSVGARAEDEVDRVDVTLDSRALPTHD